MKLSSKACLACKDAIKDCCDMYCDKCCNEMYVAGEADIFISQRLWMYRYLTIKTHDLMTTELRAQFHKYLKTKTKENNE